MELGRIRMGDIKETTQDASRDQGLTIAAVAMGFVTVVAMLHPNPLVLAVLSGLLVTGGFLFAGVVAWRHWNSEGSLPNRMVLPALIVFFGFAASILCDADAVAAAIGLVR